jgi:hypothetical protein
LSLADEGSGTKKFDAGNRGNETARCVEGGAVRARGRAGGDAGQGGASGGESRGKVACRGERGSLK